MRRDPLAEHVTQQLNGRFFQSEATLRSAVPDSRSRPAFEGFDKCGIEAAQHSNKHGQFQRGEPCQVCANQTLSDRSGEQVGNDPRPHELEQDHRNDKGHGDSDEDGNSRGCLLYTSPSPRDKS